MDSDDPRDVATKDGPSVLGPDAAARTREWLQRWRTVGPILEELHWRELAALSQSEARARALDLLKLWKPRPAELEPNDGGGLVLQQDVFRRYRERLHRARVMTNRTVLGGTLCREEDGSWRWSDGTPEPRVTDLSHASVYNFRVRTQGGRTYIEVPRSRAENEDDLAWVIAGLTTGRYELGLSGDHTGPAVWDGESFRHAAVGPGDDPLEGRGEVRLDVPIPPVILVAAEDWDAWVRTTPIGAGWDTIDQPAILERARRLGWSPDTIE